MKKKRLRTIGSKLTIMLILFAIIMCVAFCTFSYFISWDKYTEFFSEKAREAAMTAARYVDGDHIATYLETGEPDEYYNELEETLKVIKEEQNIKFLYVFVPGETSFTYIMDVEIDADDPEMMSSLGDVYEYTDIEYNYMLPDIEAKRASSKKIVLLENFYGPGVSAWAPVLDSNGEVAAMVEADMAIDIVVNALTDFVISMVLVSFGVVVVILIVMSIATRRMVSKPVAMLTENVRDFTNGESISEFKDNIRTRDELQTLSEAFGKMAEDIDKYTKNQASVAADKERIATELDLATDIQISLLPGKFPAFPDRDEFDLYATMKPAKVVGGDFYDFFMTDKTHLCVVVGGVTGKGIPAALFMVVAKTIIKNQLMTDGSVADAMTVVNSRLYESISSNMLVSAFVGLLDTQNGDFTYVNAGSCAPLIMRKDGAYDTLTGQQMSVLAETETVAFRALETKLRQGDKLVIYSEGVVGAKNPQGHRFGLDRLKAVLNDRPNRNIRIKDAVAVVSAEIENFEEGTEREEDLTVLALVYQRGDRESASVSVKATESSYEEVRAFLKRQLTENGISGASYAHLVVVCEELFALTCSKTSNSNEIDVSCNVSEGGQKTVTLSLSFTGREQELTANLTDAQKDAMDFVTKTVDSVECAYSDGRNSISVEKRLQH